MDLRPVPFLLPLRLLSGSLLEPSGPKEESDLLPYQHQAPPSGARLVQPQHHRVSPKGERVNEANLAGLDERSFEPQANGGELHHHPGAKQCVPVLRGCWRSLARIDRPNQSMFQPNRTGPKEGRRARVGVQQRDLAPRCLQKSPVHQKQ